MQYGHSTATLAMSEILDRVFQQHSKPDEALKVLLRDFRLANEARRIEMFADLAANAVVQHQFKIANNSGRQT